MGGLAHLRRLARGTALEERVAGGSLEVVRLVDRAGDCGDRMRRVGLRRKRRSTKTSRCEEEEIRRGGRRVSLPRANEAPKRRSRWKEIRYDVKVAAPSPTTPATPTLASSRRTDDGLLLLRLLDEALGETPLVAEVACERTRAARVRLGSKRGSQRQRGPTGPQLARAFSLPLSPAARNAPMPAKNARKMIQRPISWKSIRLVCSITLIVCGRIRCERCIEQSQQATREERSGKVACWAGWADKSLVRVKEPNASMPSMRCDQSAFPTNLVEGNGLLIALGSARDQENLEEELVRWQSGGEAERVVERHLGAGRERDVAEELRKEGWGDGAKKVKASKNRVKVLAWS